MKKQKRKQREINSYALVKFFLGVAVVWFIGNGLLSMLTNKAIQTQTLAYQIDEKIIATYCVLDMSEVLLPSLETGQATKLLSEGDRVRSGNAVYQVNDKTIYAPVAGLVSYKIDGYEQINDLVEFLQSDLDKQYEEQERQKKEKNETVVQDQVYSKIINSFDNVTMCVVCPVSPYINGLKKGDTLKFRLLDNGLELSGKIIETAAVSDYEKGLRVDLGCPRQEVFAQRIYKTEVFYDQRKVIAIPEKALVQQNGEDGVYTLRKGFVFWKPVIVVTERPETKQLIVNGIEAGETIVTTPHLVSEGENIKY